ncbi:MAG TPA: hypothetical protein VMX17_12535 [Candidatus Glassbacteria bacterium]|nr:hypothetical protein [Candidatus Glassbacteria bacterium]
MTNTTENKKKITVLVGIGALAIILMVINFIIRNQTTQPAEALHSAVFLICLIVAIFSFRVAVYKWRKQHRS